VESLAASRAECRTLTGFSIPAQKRIAATVDGAWMLATGEDLRYPEVEGPRGFGSGLVSAYITRFQRACHDDPKLTALFDEAVHLLVPPTAVMRPWVVLRGVGRGAGPRRRTGEGRARHPIEW
jgi:hypothetical protein